MHGMGKKMLERSFDMLKKQTYRDFEVIISDNSDDDVIKNLCENIEYSSLSIKYFKNPIKGMAENTNEAIKKATGEIIHILYMDDYFVNENSIKKIAENFEGYWMVSTCMHDNGKEIYNKHTPKYSKKILLGINTIGSPSVLTIKNKNLIFFDEKMTWVLDCDYYIRLYKKYGKPKVLNDVNVIIGTGNHQTTNFLSSFKKIRERFYMIFKNKNLF